MKRRVILLLMLGIDFINNSLLAKSVETYVEMNNQQILDDTRLVSATKRKGIYKQLKIAQHSNNYHKYPLKKSPWRNPLSGLAAIRLT